MRGGKISLKPGNALEINRKRESAKNLDKGACNALSLQIRKCLGWEFFPKIARYVTFIKQL